MTNYFRYIEKLNTNKGKTYYSIRVMVTTQTQCVLQETNLN